MPPSRKLIAMNGASRGEERRQLHALRQELADHDAARRERRQRDELERLLQTLVPQRAERPERDDGQAEERQTAHQRGEGPAAGRAVSG